MQVSHKNFNIVAIVLAVVAVALLPFWSYARWGYMPATGAIVCILVLYSLRSLART